MQSCRRNRLALAALLGLAAVHPLAAVAAPPAIASVVPNFAASPPYLAITGSQLGGPATVVRLGALPALVLKSATSTLIVANLPSPLPPAGSYRLALTVPGADGGADRIDVTLGAAGPPGPKGDPGASGIGATATDCSARHNGANLAGCDLTGLDLSYGNLTGASLVRANLIGANLVGAVVIAVDMSGASLIGANLTRANLIAANLTGADLSYANVTGVEWFGTTCPDGSNSDANGNTCLGHGGGL